MIFEGTVVCDCAADEARLRVASVFASRGYAVNGATFSRGSRLGSFLGVNPRRWKVEATLGNPSPGRFTVKLAVDATGQLVTGAEEAYWHREHGGARAALTGDQSQPDAAGRGALWANWRAPLFIVPYALLGGGLLAFVRDVAHRYGITNFALIFAVGLFASVLAGLVHWLSFEANRARKRIGRGGS